jgi:hypothetical protein
VAVGCVVLAALPAGASAARHYEMVSPLDKGQGDIVGDGVATVASRAGDAVGFSSRTPFGDTVGSGVAGQSQFVARRTAKGWDTHAVTPMPRPDAVQTFFGSTAVQIYSDDLRTAVVWAYDLPGVSSDAALRRSIYVEDTVTGVLETVTVSQADPAANLDFRVLTSWGVSADARHVTFVTRTRFLPNAAAGVPNVYQWDDGVLSLAGVLPDGSVPAAGSNLIPATYRSALSADGTRLVFTVPSSSHGPSQLFMRIDGARTVWISQPELTDDPLDPSDDLENETNPSSVELRGVTPDGHTVFFTTDAGLLDADTNGATDLYRYVDSDDPSADASNLTMISSDGDLGGGTVVGMSDDGERVYYQTAGARLSVWDHGSTHLISDAVGIPPNFRDRLGALDSEPGHGRVTPDGRYVAFAVKSPPPVDMLGNPTNGLLEMYLYDLDADALRCISCPAGAATAEVTIRPTVTDGLQVFNTGYRPHFLSDDGHVFFSTAEALVPRDRNGVGDAYEYDPATEKVSLLSTGKGSDPANFADASASGDDVFIVTRQRLVRGDLDELVDLYDVRDGSALPAPPAGPPPPCQGEGCQAPPSAAPSEDLLGSLLFDEDAIGGSNRAILVVRQRIAVRGASGVLRVRARAAATLRWSGRGLRSGSTRRGRSGTYEVPLRLGRRARERLRAAGVYRTSVHLTLVSDDGAVSRTTRVTFRAVAKKGR